VPAARFMSGHDYNLEDCVESLVQDQRRGQFAVANQRFPKLVLDYIVDARSMFAGTFPVPSVKLLRFRESAPPSATRGTRVIRKVR
jgi:hypothetical protein